MTETEYFQIQSPSFDQLAAYVDGLLKIDSTELGQATQNSSHIFVRLYRLLNIEATSLRSAMSLKAECEHDRRRRYLGKHTAEHYRNEPLNETVMKTDVENYMAIDSKVIKIRDFVAERDARVKFVEDAIKVCKNRTYDIRNALQWKQMVPT